ncbi:MAG: hypothetical protein AAFY26_01000 [Cyanobacteria bacterium J06638_22]
MLRFVYRLDGQILQRLARLYGCVGSPISALFVRLLLDGLAVRSVAILPLNILLTPMGDRP